MNEVEVIIFSNHVVIKSQSDKSPAFLCSAVILSHLVHSLSGLNYMCKAKYQPIGNG